jgi:hypothetical protein
MAALSASVPETETNRRQISEPGAIENDVLGNHEVKPTGAMS